MKLLEPSCYQSLASAAYESVVDELSPLLTDARFEHIGASAIPGEISKGDLDIALQVVAAGSEFEFFMHFRDALLANACLVHQYNITKSSANLLPLAQIAVAMKKQNLLYPFLKVVSKIL